MNIALTIAATIVLLLAALGVLALGVMIAGLERADDQGGWDE